MNIWHAIVLGIVEGVTEFLPVSSTGHLILATRFLGLEQTEFLKSFDIIIQLGAILAVIALYWRRLILDPRVMKLVAAAFLPTAVAGFILYKIVKKFLLGNAELVLWALLLGGIFLIVFELLHKEKESVSEDLSSITFMQAFIIGLIQSLAMVPGVSRAAATIIGGLMLGLKRKTIVEFSFLLAIPTMAAATGLDLLKNAQTFSFEQVHFLVTGFVISFIVAVLSIKFLLHFIKHHNFIAFGVYRIMIALLGWEFLSL